MPSLIVLRPADRVVRAPAGDPPQKIVGQSADTVRSSTQEWVWVVGSAGTLSTNDSTPARTIVIRLESPVTSGQVTLTAEAFRVTPEGWIIVDDEIPAPNATKLISEPGKSFEWYRTDAIIGFYDHISDAAKQAFFAETGLTVLGVTTDGSFYVRIPDPGSSWTAFQTYYESLRARSEVETAVARSRTPTRLVPRGRWPSDGPGNQRADWVRDSDSLWAMLAIQGR